ncbi:hypothetical protein MPTK1_3g14000 [Marchantia polymorpha subsp. ruderalis]|uniref:Phytocyanin domain-containing protein n=2 Tax=Marchantia polymorpha TaxID=3197 RepID=A0A176VV55_MARPO|nr:hypothetical protein AXG93_2601s1050 [Marchantia polymorpha subsp. ruderalis]PTQ49044.1 hypothetical protein MARPO_0004s0271 [Marchantia polymorpha]BBN05540.1 hypothetical protein Mp_3g14000 [Marchantia polymorpha subsp. ruderalis]|eukprot:PTQ49044.1 hypothetical protein MARPO_0004s0271 [Marchantia polymorpha]
MGTGKCLALLVLCVLGALVQSSSAALYKVGDSAGWSIPSSATFYDEWAKKQTFQVGDILEFDYSMGNHDVLSVTAADAKSCNSATPLFSWSVANARVTLLTPGTQSFICGISGHCTLGMAMTVQVLPAAPAPAPPAPQIPPPPPAPRTTPTTPSTPSTPPTPTTPSTPSTPAPSKAPAPPTRRSPVPPTAPAPVAVPVAAPDAPAPAPRKARKGKKPLGAPSPAPIEFSFPSSSLAVAPAPVAEKAAASGLRSAAFMVAAALAVSCASLLF